MVLDAATGEEVRRFVVEAAVSELSSLEWDGSYGLLGRGSDAGPIVVAPDGSVHEIDGSWSAFRREA
jgi:hypothetical protein